MRFVVRTYGCQMNERDSGAVTALLLRHGHTCVADESDAELVIVNTCSVRGKAEDKALGKLRQLVRSARGPRWVGAVGCMVQRLGPALLERVPGLDFAVGPRRLGRLPGVVELVMAGRGPVLDTSEEGGAEEALTDHAEGGVTAFVNILLGCNRRCTYCIVPTVRGPEWSRPAAAVLQEIRSLAASGVREVTLLGQSVMAYGQAQPVWEPAEASPGGFREPLPRLLEAASAVEGIARLRFTSGHPSGCTPELARAMATLPAVCPHLHLPLQSGADRLLARMGRGYDAAAYRAAVARLRAAVPDLALTTDIIVGFPGETLAEFDATRACMEEIGFDNAFIFKYSPRPGTEAAKWEDDVPAEEKLRRNHVLLEDQERRGLRLNGAWVGRTVEVLVEGVSRRSRERWAGRSRTNKLVVFAPGAGVTPGALVNVRLERAAAQTLYGTVTGPAGPTTRPGGGGST